jgi:phospholipid transport system substrate-binding protein
MTPHRSARPLFNVALAAMFALGIGAVAGLALAPTPAVAQNGARDAQAEQFVQVQAQRALTVLANPKMTTADKTRLFRAFVDQVADVPRITQFVLGKYARVATPAQRQAFAVVFREYASNVYESRLDQYHGEVLKVTGSIVRRPGDVIVNSVVVGGAQSKPVAVAWRVIGGGAGWKVIDVQVAGVWLAITEQQDFVSTIDNAGGNVDVLTRQLQQKVQAERK